MKKLTPTMLNLYKALSQKAELDRKIRQYNTDKDWAAQVNIEAITDPVEKEKKVKEFLKHQEYQNNIRKQTRNPLTGWRVGGRSRNRKSRRQKRKGTRRRYRRS